MLTLFCAAFLMLSWFLSSFAPSPRHPLPFLAALGTALGGGIFAVYLAPWIISMCPSEVQFYEKYLARVQGNTAPQTNYADLQTFSWRVGPDFATLILTRRDGKRPLLLGAPLDVSREDVSEFLLERGLVHGDIEIFKT